MEVAALPRWTLSRLFASFILLALMLSTLFVGIWARGEMLRKAQIHSDMAHVFVTPPSAAPSVSQESIDLALVLYGIEVPDAAEHPVVDLKLQDRGLTTRATFLERAVVTVGPSAFQSWALLGSTLAHELEVHCQQNFLAIYLMDAVGLDGTGAAEREAYVHELVNAKRFGLKQIDALSIAETMNYFYPERTLADGLNPRVMPDMIRTWLSQNVIRGQAAQ